MSKVGRNDPCPCGSGKKYKTCCMTRPAGSAKKKFKAVLLSKPKEINLIERTFGESIATTTDKPLPFRAKLQNPDLEKAEE